MRAKNSVPLFDRMQTGTPRAIICTDSALTTSMALMLTAAAHLTNESGIQACQIIIYAVLALLRHRDAHLTALAHIVCADAPN
jgi:hypothetical protein